VYYRIRICIASYCCEEPNPDLAYRVQILGEQRAWKPDFTVLLC
jgi:hypothetical protein